MAIVLSVVLYHFLGDDYYNEYETPMLAAKLEYFHRKDFNTAFVGTSKTLRQVDPKKFSQLANENMNAFNMGVAGLFPFRMLDYGERVSEKAGIKNMFVELAPLDIIGINYDSNPNILALNFGRFWKAFEHISYSQISNRIKLSYYVNYCKALSYKYLGIGAEKQLALILESTVYPNAEKESKIDRTFENDGFITYTQLVEMGQMPAYRLKDHNALKANPKLLESTIKTYKKTQASLSAVEDGYIKEYLEFASKISEKGIIIVFYLPPRQLDYGLAPVLNLRDRLKEKGYAVLDCSDPTEYPELYTLENSFDVSHLNKNGAALFTEALAKQYNQLNH